MRGHGRAVRFPLVRIDWRRTPTWPASAAATHARQAAPLGAQAHDALRREGRLLRPGHAPRPCGREGELRPGRRAKRWRWSASPAAASRRPGARCCASSTIEGGSIEFAGRDIAEAPGERVRRVRRDIQMIFQDPFASLDPRLTVGFSIAEPLYVHGVAKGREAEERVRWLLQHVGLSPDHGAPLSARILRRPAAAHLHRARAGARSEDHRRRRSGLRARRLDQGADRQPDARPAGRVRPFLPLHLARHGGGRARQPSRRGHVSGRDRRDRPARARSSAIRSIRTRAS